MSTVRAGDLRAPVTGRRLTELDDSLGAALHADRRRPGQALQRPRRRRLRRRPRDDRRRTPSDDDIAEALGGEHLSDVTRGTDDTGQRRRGPRELRPAAARGLAAHQRRAGAVPALRAGPRGDRQRHAHARAAARGRAADPLGGAVPDRAARLPAPAPHGAARRPDRAGQPRPPAGARAASGWPRHPRGRDRRAAADRPRPLPGGQRHARPRPGRRPAAPRRASASRDALRRRTTCSPASAPTCSPCCARACRTARPPRRSPGACTTRSGRPFDLAGVAIELEASIGIALSPDHGRDDRRRCCARPTSPWTSPSRTGRARRPTTARATGTPPSGWRCSASCAARSADGRARPALPAQGRHRRRRGRRRRGAHPLAASRARAARPGGVHAARRAHRPDRPADRAGCSTPRSHRRASGGSAASSCPSRSTSAPPNVLDVRLPDLVAELLGAPRRAAAPADLRDLRGHGPRRPAADDRQRSPAARRWASGWPSTTSAPARPRCPTSSSSRSTSSRSTARSSPA